jgi:hypothetical protein
MGIAVAKSRRRVVRIETAPNGSTAWSESYLSRSARVSDLKYFLFRLSPWFIKKKLQDFLNRLYLSQGRT